MRVCKEKKIMENKIIKKTRSSILKKGGFGGSPPGVIRGEWGIGVSLGTY